MRSTTNEELSLGFFEAPTSFSATVSFLGSLGSRPSRRSFVSTNSSWRTFSIATFLARVSEIVWKTSFGHACASCSVKEACFSGNFSRIRYSSLHPILTKDSHGDHASDPASLLVSSRILSSIGLVRGKPMDQRCSCSSIIGQSTSRPSLPLSRTTSLNTSVSIPNATGAVVAIQLSGNGCSVSFFPSWFFLAKPCALRRSPSPPCRRSAKLASTRSSAVPRGRVGALSSDSASSANFIKPSSSAVGGSGSASFKKSRLETDGDSEVMVVTGEVSYSAPIWMAGRIT
mmetsp:Transcript_31515/g.68144  ORF Transcript_31515/g.68144 Transcript_31515/m.68144 type:complete len:287 (-) Transcript_31515:548-1408(-)